MIGIIGAMRHEVELLQNKIENVVQENICGMRFFSGKINNNDVVVTMCGVGKVNAAVAASVMIDTYECRLLINTGIAGGIQNVSTGDVIIASKLMYHDFDTTCFGYKLGQVPGMPAYYCPTYEDIINIKGILNRNNIKYKEALVLSGDTFVNTKTQIQSEFLTPNTSIVCEMEGTAVAQVACKASVSFVVLRYVSDIVDSESQLSDYAEFEKEMAKMSSQICFDILNNI